MLPRITHHVAQLFGRRRRQRTSHSSSLQTATVAAEDACAHAAPSAFHLPHKLGTKADPLKATPRADFLSWEEYFMAVAFLSAKRSKDPNKQASKTCLAVHQQSLCC